MATVCKSEVNEGTLYSCFGTKNEDIGEAN